MSGLGRLAPRRHRQGRRPRANPRPDGARAPRTRQRVGRGVVAPGSSESTAVITRLGRNSTVSRANFRLETRTFKLQTGSFKLDILSFKLERAAFMLETRAFRLETGSFRDEIRALKHERGISLLERARFKLQSRASEAEQFPRIRRAAIRCAPPTPHRVPRRRTSHSLLRTTPRVPGNRPGRLPSWGQSGSIALRSRGR